MIEKWNSQHFPSGNQLIRYLNILFAWCRVTTRMIMSNDNRRSLPMHGLLKHLSCASRHSIQRSCAYADRTTERFVGCVKRQNPEMLAFISKSQPFLEPCRGIRSFIHRAGQLVIGNFLIGNPYQFKRSGQFHAFDFSQTKDASFGMRLVVS